MKASSAGQLYRVIANVARGPMDEYGLPGGLLGHNRRTDTTGAEAAFMKFRVLGFCAIILAKASAYSAYAR
jgi:hypothetical protein